MQIKSAGLGFEPPLATSLGGTGTTTTFGSGSIVFAGLLGNYTQDAADFTYDAANNFLQVGVTNGGGIGVGMVPPANGLFARVADGATNSVTEVVRFSHTTSGTAAAGFGLQANFEAENASGTNRIIGRLEFVYTVATNAAEESNFIVRIAVGGALAVEVLRVGPNGVQGAEITLTDGANVAINAALFTPGSVGRLTMGGNRTIDNPTNPKDRQLLSLEIFSTASRTITWDSKFKGSADLPLPTATTGSSKTDLLLFRYNLAADQWWLVAKNFGFAA